MSAIKLSQSTNTIEQLDTKSNLASAILKSTKKIKKF